MCISGNETPALPTISALSVPKDTRAADDAAARRAAIGPAGHILTNPLGISSATTGAKLGVAQ